MQRMASALLVVVLSFVGVGTLSAQQQATVNHGVSLRGDPSSARNALQRFAAGEVRGSKFFPFAAKGPAHWESGPYELEENLGQAARSPQIIDLRPFEGKSLFLDVAQLPQFYGVRVLGSCDSQLGNVLWENTWDRGGLVLDLLSSGQKSKSGRLTVARGDPRLPPRPRVSTAATGPSKEPPFRLAAGPVKHGKVHGFRMVRTGKTDMLEIKTGNALTLGSEVSPSELGMYEGRAVFISIKKDNGNAQILGACDNNLASALWAASTDRGKAIVSAMTVSH